MAVATAFLGGFCHDSFENFLHVVLLFAVAGFLKCGLTGCVVFLRQLALAVVLEFSYG